MGKKKDAARTKAVEAERDARIAVLQQAVDAPEGMVKKKERKRAQAELDALLALRGSFTPSTAPTAGLRTSEPGPAKRTVADLDALAERAARLKQRIAADSATPNAPSSAAQPAGYDRHDGEDEVAYQWRKQEEAKARDAWAAARRTIVAPDEVSPEDEAHATMVQPDGTLTVTPTFQLAAPTSALPFEVPEDPVLTNGNGRPMIWAAHPKEGAKLTAYTRVTTYIDVLEDKSMLDKWKTRTLLEGAYLEEASYDDLNDASSVQAVGRSMTRRDATLADLDEREANGDVFTIMEREAAVKEHKDFTNRIVENLLDIGGAHAKADAGTRLHHLTELVDNGQPVPEWATASERLDLQAYQRAVEAAGLSILWAERRVVDDELGTTGTMDRAYLGLLPGRTRRVRMVGDLKTGNVEWGAGKIGMQLAAYARGKGYVHDREHLEREDLRLSRTDALLIHLPAGEHRCSIYLVDLTLASKGLALAAQVRAWRNEGKRVYDLKKPMHAVEVPAEPAVAS